MNEVVEKFAEALDKNEFEVVASLLSANCEYFISGKLITGAEQIVNSYKSADSWAQKTFDSVEYESVVDGNQVTFIDHISHKGYAHTHRCVQVICLDNDNLIFKIEHHELDGEKELVDEFFTKVGVSRREETQ
ncbi:MAG: hypothetical protein QF718_03120 [Phycisphaerales bacterium]|jgi:hypothetical protein|nr:hypothetical protein [Phycisphaerales bacterium]|tara:strand:+ start:402 stop:800 length:399 start_codon:yes stop_codon:yes gene_type:complete